MIFGAVAFASRLAAGWCGHVDAAAALAGCPRAHGADGTRVVPEGEPGDADPRGAGRGVRRCAVCRCVRGAGPAGDLPGPVDDGQCAAVFGEPDGPAGGRGGPGPDDVEVRAGPGAGGSGV